MVFMCVDFFILSVNKKVIIRIIIIVGKLINVFIFGLKGLEIVFGMEI